MIFSRKDFVIMLLSSPKSGLVKKMKLICIKTNLIIIITNKNFINFKVFINKK